MGKLTSLPRPLNVFQGISKGKGGAGKDIGEEREGEKRGKGMGRK